MPDDADRFALVGDERDSLEGVDETGGAAKVLVPRGTDTVPAMLTPGEFVVNAKATAENYDLLRAINSGSPLFGGYGGGVLS